MVAIAAGQTLTASLLNAKLQKCIARGRRTSTSSSSTGTDVGVLRVPAVCRANKIYVVTCAVALDSSVTNDEIRARIRYTTDGTNPSVSSTILPGSLVSTRQTDANVPEDKTILAVYPAATDHTATFLLCVGRIAGSGSCTIAVDTANGASLDLSVLDLGDDPGNTGVSI